MGSVQSLPPSAHVDCCASLPLKAEREKATGLCHSPQVHGIGSREQRGGCLGMSGECGSSKKPALSCSRRNTSVRTLETGEKVRGKASVCDGTAAGSRFVLAWGCYGSCVGRFATHIVLEAAPNIQVQAGGLRVQVRGIGKFYFAGNLHCDIGQEQVSTERFSLGPLRATWPALDVFLRASCFQIKSHCTTKKEWKRD